MMFGNGNCAKKPTTNFTIECILSKDDRKENGDNNFQITHNHSQQQQPLALNKVLDNPWIPRTPLALSFNPSSYHRKINFSNIPMPPTTYEYLPSTPPLAVTPPILTAVANNNNFIQNLVKTTQHHTSAHNHFYSIPTNDMSVTSHHQQLIKMKHFSNTTILSSSSSTSSLSSLEKDLKLSKMNVYDCNKLCDTQLLSLDDSKKVIDNKSSLLPISNEIKCSICSKHFDNSELMDVS